MSKHQMDDRQNHRYTGEGQPGGGVSKGILDDMLQYIKLVIQYESKLSHSSFKLHVLELGNSIRVSFDESIESASWNTHFLACLDNGHPIVGVLDDLSELQ